MKTARSSADVPQCDGDGDEYEPNDRERENGVQREQLIQQQLAQQEALAGALRSMAGRMEGNVGAGAHALVSLLRVQHRQSR